jgi:hypothetical protein
MHVARRSEQSADQVQLCTSLGSFSQTPLRQDSPEWQSVLVTQAAWQLPWMHELPLAQSLLAVQVVCVAHTPPRQEHALLQVLVKLQLSPGQPKPLHSV